jgi:hypothetical protein
MMDSLQNFLLQPLSKTFFDEVIEDSSFGRLSSTYNNMLSLSAVGVSNEAGGGWERRNGDHSVTLNGRTFTYIPKAGNGAVPSGGISYFTFDHQAAEALKAHVTAIRERSMNRTERIQRQFRRRLANINGVEAEVDEGKHFYGMSIIPTSCFFINKTTNDNFTNVDGVDDIGMESDDDECKYQIFQLHCHCNCYNHCHLPLSHETGTLIITYLTIKITIIISSN